MSQPATPPHAPAVPRLGQGIVFLSREAEVRHAYHPSLNVLSEREWYVSFDVGASTESLDYHTRGTRTTDGGATWTDAGPLVARPASPPTTHTIRTRHFGGGRMIGFGKWEDRLGYETQRSNRQTLGQVPMRLFWIESRDHGRTWSPPRWIEPPLVGPTWELCHPIIPLPDGSWAAPVATWRGWNGDLPNGEVSGLLVSSDQGATWPRFVPTFDGRQSGCIHWEQSVAVRRDGSLVATAWVYDPRTRETRPSVFVTSPDGGRTFTAPRPTGFLAQTCKVLELKSGKVVTAYRRHDQPGLWVELAAVDAAGWRTERRGLLWGGVASGMSGKTSTSEELNQLRFGYPSLAELGDGSVLIAFWGSSDRDRNAIHWLRFDPNAI
ncbi:MAG: exo-alpha-sialidase [Opitutaceae bacterium]|nr:exo-alpha-sialidase [Opitutaceae bacterium]